MRTEGLSILAALALHAALVLVARALPPLSLLSASDRRDLRTIDIDLPPPVTSVPLAERAPVTEPRAQADPDKAIATRTTRPSSPPRETGPRPEVTAEQPTAPTQPKAPTRFDDLPEEPQGVLGMNGVPGLGGNAVWTMPGVIPSSVGAPAPAPTEAPARRPVDGDIGGKVVRDAMSARDKTIGIDLPAAGAVASVVADVVRGSDVPDVSKGSIEFRVGANGQVLGYRVITTRGGSSDAWDRAARAAAARLSGSGLAMTGAYTRGATITVDVSSNLELPAGGKGGFTGTGMTFDLSNIGAHTRRMVRTSFRVAAAR